MTDIHVFSGSATNNVSLQLTKYSIHSLDCSGQSIIYFPFEEYICELTFSSANFQLVIQTRGASLGYRYTENFIIEKARLVSLNRDSDGAIGSKALLKIHIKRLMGFYIVAVFLPSFFLLFLNSISLWVTGPPEYRLATSLFVVIAFFAEWLMIISNAPETSMVRAIDVWMNFCIVHSFLHVMVHVIIQAVDTPNDKSDSNGPYSRRQSRTLSFMRPGKSAQVSNIYDVLLAKMADEENKNTWTLGYWIMFSMRVVSPALSLLFMLAYWCFIMLYTREAL